MNFRKTTKKAPAASPRPKSDVRKLSVRELASEELRIVSGGATSIASYCCSGKHIPQGKITA